MIKNSQRRISKRREGALGRRIVNLKAWGSKNLLGASEAEIQGVHSKIEIAKKDIENLQKKGVRHELMAKV